MTDKPQPRYKVGDRKDSFTVRYYCGHTDVGPDGRHLSKRQHWYEVECDCGEVETLNQGMVITRTACLQCTNEQKAKKISAIQRSTHAPQEPTVPDFARMKLT